LSLDLVKPFAAYQFGTGRQRNKISSVNAMNSSQFFIQCLLPLWILY